MRQILTTFLTGYSKEKQEQTVLFVILRSSIDKQAFGDSGNENVPVNRQEPQAELDILV